MKGTRVALRYAKAALSNALEMDKANVMALDMQTISTTLKNSRDLEVVLNSPIISADLKASTLKAVFSNLTEQTQSFLLLVANNNRAAYLDGIAHKYVELYNNHLDKQEAIVTTAIPLTPTLQKEVLNKIKALTTKEVSITNKIDPNLIGGFLLRIGDLQYDASVSNQLQTLKQKFKQHTSIA